MDRTLRVLAIVALAFLVLFFFLSQLPLQIQTAMSGSGSPNSANLFLVDLPALLLNLAGQTTFAVCLGVGVAALVAAIQRRQRWWAVGLVALLLLAANGSYLVLALASLLEGARFSLFALVGSLLPEALAPLAVLVYTISPYSRVPPAIQPVQPTPALE